MAFKMKHRGTPVFFGLLFAAYMNKDVSVYCMNLRRSGREAEKDVEMGESTGHEVGSEVLEGSAMNIFDSDTIAALDDSNPLNLDQAQAPTWGHAVLVGQQHALTAMLFPEVVPNNDVNCKVLGQKKTRQGKKRSRDDAELSKFEAKNQLEEYWEQARIQLDNLAVNLQAEYKLKSLPHIILTREQPLSEQLLPLMKPETVEGIAPGKGRVLMFSTDGDALEYIRKLEAKVGVELKPVETHPFDFDRVMTSLSINGAVALANEFVPAADQHSAGNVPLFGSTDSGASSAAVACPGADTREEMGSNGIAPVQSVVSTPPAQMDAQKEYSMSLPAEMVSDTSCDATPSSLLHDGATMGNVTLAELREACNTFLTKDVKTEKSLGESSGEKPKMQKHKKSREQKKSPTNAARKSSGTKSTGRRIKPLVDEANNKGTQTMPAPVISRSEPHPAKRARKADLAAEKCAVTALSPQRQRSMSGLSLNPVPDMDSFSLETVPVVPLGNFSEEMFFGLGHVTGEIEATSMSTSGAAPSSPPNSGFFDGDCTLFGGVPPQRTVSPLNNPATSVQTASSTGKKGGSKVKKGKKDPERNRRHAAESRKRKSDEKERQMTSIKDSIKEIIESFQKIIPQCHDPSSREILAKFQTALANYFVKLGLEDYFVGAGLMKPHDGTVKNGPPDVTKDKQPTGNQKMVSYINGQVADADEYFSREVRPQLVEVVNKISAVYQHDGTSYIISKADSLCNSDTHRTILVGKMTNEHRINSLISDYPEAYATPEHRQDDIETKLYAEVDISKTKSGKTNEKSRRRNCKSARVSRMIKLLRTEQRKKQEAITAHFAQLLSQGVNEFDTFE